MEYPVLILGGYLIALIAVTLVSARKESGQEYMIGARRVGAFPIMASLVGNLRDGAGVAAWVLLSAFFGFGAIWLTIGLCAGLAVLAVWAPRIRQLAAERDYVSVSQLIQDSVGTKTARLSTLIIAVTAILYAAAQLFVAGSLSAGLFGLSSGAAIALVALIVGLYLILGGYKATILTGIVQWFVLLLILLLPFVLGGNGATIPSVTSFTNIDFLTAFGFFGISFLVVLSSADIWQLIFSSKLGGAARSGLLQSIPVYLLISVGMVIFGATAISLLGEGVNPQTALFDLFASPLVSGFTGSLVAVFLLAALMSTLDSQVFLFTSTVIKQFKPSLASTDPILERYTRYGIGVVMVLLALVASQISDLVEFLFSAVTLGTILVPLLVYAVLRKGRAGDDVWVAAVIIGIIVYVFMFARGSFENVSLTLVPAVVTMLIAILGLKLTQSHD